MSYRLSYTRMSTYLTCPLRYKFQYVDGIAPAFTSSSLAFGTGIHEAVGAFHQSHLEGDRLRPDQMMDVYRQNWKTQENLRFFNGTNEDTLTAKAKDMLTVYYNSFDPSASILGVEEFFEFQLEEMPPFQGYIDLIEKSESGSVSIVDLKTASKRYSDSTVQNHLQLTAYSLGAQVLGFNSDELSLRFDVLLKTKTVELVRYETQRTQADHTRFVKLLREVWNGIEQEVWYPRDDWNCSQCAWAQNCADW